MASTVAGTGEQDSSSSDNTADSDTKADLECDDEDDGPGCADTDSLFNFFPGDFTLDIFQVKNAVTNPSRDFALDSYSAIYHTKRLQTVHDIHLITLSRASTEYEPVHCSMKVASLVTEMTGLPIYYALGYTWGNTDAHGHYPSR